MSLLFNRVVFIDVGDANEAIRIPTTFKIAFSIQKLIGANSAQGSVSIYNLADETKELIRDRGKRIRVYGGYQSIVALFHDGDILRTAQTDEGANRKTDIFLGNNVFTITNAIFSSSYGGQTPVKSIVRQMLLDIGLPFGEDQLRLIPDNYIVNNYAYSGRAIDGLNDLLAPQDLQWYDNNGQSTISKRGLPNPGTEESAVVLNSTSGLIKTAVQTDRGINATCLLNPRLQPGTVVRIDSDVVRNQSFNTFFTQKNTQNTQGFYKIIQATYQGDNWDGKFEALIQCVPYGEANAIG